MKKDLNPTTGKKAELNSTLNSLIKLQREVSQTKRLILHLRVLVLVSLSLCVHHASSVLLDGKNVLYITLEMAEEKIAERIDANLLNVNIQNITELPKPMFESKVNNLTKKTQGTLIIKEYPTASAHSGHFKSLLNELALKKSFVPDIIFIDYLNICASSRYRTNNNVNSYSYIKAIAEELRGLAVEANLPIVSATQTTRSGLVVVMLILLIQVNPLVFLPLLILCLLLFLRRNLRVKSDNGQTT